VCSFFTEKVKKDRWKTTTMKREKEREKERGIRERVKEKKKIERVK
jgi:hypothetical protein